MELKGNFPADGGRQLSSQMGFGDNWPQRDGPTEGERERDFPIGENLQVTFQGAAHSPFFHKVNIKHFVYMRGKRSSHLPPPPAPDALH